MPIIRWFERNSKWMQGAAALLAIAVTLAGTGTWVFSVQSKIDTLQAQMQGILTAPKDENGANSPASVHAQMCTNLTDRLAEAYTNGLMSTQLGIEREMENLGCKPAK